MILEISKSYVWKYYGGNSAAAKEAKDGILWTDENIKAAFNNGNGSTKDLKNYISNNKKYAYFVEV